MESDLPPRNKENLVAVAAIGALVAVLFFKPLFRGWAFYARDILFMRYPQVETFVRCVFSGSWPVWDPYFGFGQPMAANPGLQVLYPWTWLNLLLAPPSYYTAYVASHVLFAGVGLFRLARRMGLSSHAALAAAGIWMLSGPLLSLVPFWHHLAGAAWMPWVLLTTDCALGAPSLGTTLGWGLCTAAQILSGSVDMMAITALLVAGLVAIRTEWRRPLVSPNRRRAAATAGALLIALGLSAVQWLPAAELLPGTSRTERRESLSAAWSLPPVGLTQCLLPVFPCDLPLKPVVRERLYPEGEAYLASIYLGLAACPLVAAALAGSRRGRAVALLGIVVVACTLALGRYAGLYGLAVWVAPPFGIFRYPVKVMILAALGWALLTGLGLDALREKDAGRRRCFLVLLVGLLTTLAAAAGALLFHAQAVALAARFLNPEEGGSADLFAPTASGLAWAAAFCGVATVLAVLRDGRLRMAVAACAVLDLLVAHRTLNPTAPRSLVQEPPPTLQALAHAARIYSFDYATTIVGKSYRRPPASVLYSPRAEAGWPRSLVVALGLEALVPPTVAPRWGFYGSYTIDMYGIQPRALVSLTLLLRVSEETPAFLRLLRLGGVSHVVSLHEEGLEDLVPVATFPGHFQAPVRVYRVPDPLPRTYVVGEARIATGREAYRTLVDPSFAPEREVVLEEGRPVRHEHPRSGASRIVELRPDRVVLEAAADGDAWVVLLDAYDPGWRARVDGHDAPVLRANVGFRAVPIGAGRHRIELDYRPPSVSVGLWVSTAALLLVLALGAGLLVRARR